MKISAKHIAALGAAAMALANVGRIPMGAFGGRTAPFVVADLVTALVCGLVVVLVLGRQLRPTLDDISLPAAAFALVAALSTAIAVARYHMGAREAAGTAAFLVRWTMYFGWYLFVVWCLTPDESRAAWRYVERAILAVALFGIVQSALLPGFAQTLHSGSALPVWDVQGRRLVSTLLDPNFAGLLIAVLLLFRLARVAEGIQEPGNTWVLPMLAAALVLTASRSSVLALFVGLGVIVLLRGLHAKFAYVVFTGFVLAVPALFAMRGYLARMGKLGIDTSAAERLIPWSRAWVLLREHPVLGIGFNAARPAQVAHGWLLLGSADVSLDAGLLFIAAMTGLVGLAVYLWMLWQVSRVSRQVYRDADLPAADRAHGVATVASTVAVVVHAFFVNSILVPFVMQILWVMWGTLMHIAAKRRLRIGAAAAALPLLIVLGGCEPCAGTNVCGTASRLDLQGQIVDGKTGVPVPGANVSVTLADGSQLSATTDGNGDWEVAHDAISLDSTPVTATVVAPGHSGYTTPAFYVTPVTRKGDATILGAWLSYPHAYYQATLLKNGKPVVGAAVKFKPIGGVPATGVFTGSTNGSGSFSLEVSGEQLGTVVGNLTVTSASLGAPNVITGWLIPLGYKYKVAAPVAAFSLGGLLTYGGQVHFRGTGANVSGVSVRWERTGGINTVPGTYITTTDSSGFFLLQLQPGGSGNAIGKLTFIPPGGPITTYQNVTLATYDSTSYRYLGNFGYGEQWAWAIAVWRNDSLKPAAGVPVTFRRTGGIAITPDSIQDTTGADGYIRLRAGVTASGFVDGELVVRPDSGPARTITGLHLKTYAADTTDFAGVFGYGPSLHYAGQIMDADSVPVKNATVTWTRDYGLDATPHTLTSTTDNTGYFDLWLYPPDNTDGTVVGHLTVTPGSPYPAGSQYTINYVSLKTFLSADRRFSWVFIIPNP